MKQFVLKSAAIIVNNSEDYTWFDSIDMLLGDRKRRYLGSGYKRVTHHITNIEFNAYEKTIIAIASIFYPDDWSQKSEGDRKDIHLSTLDILLISSRICEVFLSLGCGLTDTEVESSRIILVEMSLGNAPTINLLGLQFMAKYCGSLKLDNARELSVSKLEIKVGKAKISISIEHSTPRNSDLFLNLQREVIPAALNIVNDVEGKLYGDRYKHKEMDLTDISINKKESGLSCIMRMKKAGNTPEIISIKNRPKGMSSAFPQAIEVMDLMISGAQLSQILIYNTGNVSRDKTSNLWMRHFTVYCNDIVSGIGSSLPVTVAISKSKIIEIKNKRYYVTDLDYNIPGCVDLGGKGSFVQEV